MYVNQHGFAYGFLMQSLIDPIYPYQSSGFVLQAMFGGSMYGQNPSYLSERFPTEVRATAAGFVYHQGAIFGGLIPPILTYLAVDKGYGFAMPMMWATMASATVVILAILVSPETRGQEMVADLQVFEKEEYP